MEDEDGCPDEGRSKVKVTATRVEILEKVYFATAKAEIRKRSHDVLNQVASILKANQQITRLRIEGHTDNQGDAAYNMRLSQERAEAVLRYLTGRGVSGRVLVAKGFGESKPIAKNTSNKGRAKNRRVEFVIVEIDGKPAASNLPPAAR